MKAVRLTSHNDSPNFGTLCKPTDLALRRSGGFGELYGAIFAVPAVAEKGYLDVRVEVSSPGGHSSIPPAHTVSADIVDSRTFLITFRPTEHRHSLFPSRKIRGKPVRSSYQPVNSCLRNAAVLCCTWSFASVFSPQVYQAVSQV